MTVPLPDDPSPAGGHPQRHRRRFSTRHRFTAEEGDALADEKVLEEIKLHQDVIDKDSASPLHQIREKEIEIAGRVLAAKQQAETIIADARRESAELITQAHADGDVLARELEAKTIAKAEEAARALREGVGVEVSAIESQVKERVPAAVDVVVKAVTEV